MIVELLEFDLDIPVVFLHKKHIHNITEILLKVALNTTKHTQ